MCYELRQLARQFAFANVGVEGCPEHDVGYCLFKYCNVGYFNDSSQASCCCSHDVAIDIGHYQGCCTGTSSCNYVRLLSEQRCFGLDRVGLLSLGKSTTDPDLRCSSWAVVPTNASCASSRWTTSCY